MKPNSIMFKIFFIMLFLAIVLTAGSAYFVRERVEKDIAMHMDDEADIVTEALNYAVTPLIEADDSEGIIKVLEVFTSYDVIRGIRIHDTEGLVLYSSNPDEVGEERPSTLLSLAADNPEAGRQSIQVDDNVLMSFVPLVCGHGGQSIGEADAILCVAMDFKYTESIANNVSKDLSTAFIFITVVFFVLLYIAMQKILGQPLHKFADAVEEISQNNYAHRIEINSKSELSDLASTFNKMAENIEEDAVNLARARDTAEKASKARLEFLANMSHEIRTPLNAIIGFSDIISEELTDPNQKESMNIVVNSGNHLLNLVNEILDIAKIENDQMLLESQPFSMRSIVGDVRNMFYLATAEKNVELSYEVDVNVPAMYIGDLHRIKQILMNLVSNAVKFTNEGAIEILVRYEAPDTIIEIIDSGIGIPKDKQESIFEVYAQSDSSTTRLYGGTGLGLAISNKLAQMMNGGISLTSEVGKGSTFKVVLRLEQLMLRMETGSQMVEKWLYADSTVEDIVKEVIESLPERLQNIEEKAAQRDSQQLEFYVHSLKGVSGNFNIMEIYTLAQDFESHVRSENIDYDQVDAYIYKLREIVRKIPNEMVVPDQTQDVAHDKGDFKILLAEDVKANQLLIRQILKNHPVEIDTADNGAEAIELLEKNKYDCLLLDIQMPILSGEDVLRWIRSSGEMEAMFIVALTANAFKEDMEKYLSLGAHWFLSKPVKKDLLRGKIKDLIQLKGDTTL